MMHLRYRGLSVAALSLTALGLVALPSGAWAQDNNATGTTNPSTSPNGTVLPTTPVTLNVESADLYYTLKLLFSQIHADFTLDTSLRGTPVTVKLTKVPFDIALNAVLKASGQPLTYSFENGIFSIVPQVTETAPAVTTPETPQQDLTANTRYEKIYLSVASVQDVMMALNRPIVQTSQGFSSGGGMGGGFGGGFGGGGMGGMMGGMGGMGGFGGGMGGMMGGMGGFGGGGMGGFGGGGMGGFGGGGMGGFGGGGFGGGRGF
jgi:hypothetical protein